MPEHLRALCVIFFFALPTFWLARRWFNGAGLVSAEEFTRDVKAWVIVTLIAFFAHNFWLFLIAAGWYIYLRCRDHQNGIAVYCLLLLALPPDSRVIPGIGPIDQIVELNYYRLLNLCILLPLVLRIRREGLPETHAGRAIDTAVIGLLLWMGLIRFLSESPIHALRGMFYGFTDLGLPYYAASRCLRSIEQFRRLAASVIVSGAILAVLAVFESTRHWLLYSALPSTWGFPEGVNIYLLRSEGGGLRAKVSLGNSIVLGYVLLWAVGMAVYAQSLLKDRTRILTVFGVLVAGLIATLSRGPWVGTAALLAVVFVLGPGLGKRLAKGIAIGSVVALLLLISPYGDTVVSYLPFVGNVETGTVDYRARLFDVSMIVFKQNPIMGDLHYLKNPIMEQMRQGEGIIDMVNTYLQIALPFGFIGLFFFVLAFLAGIGSVQRARRMHHNDPETELLGRCLIATVVGIMVTIATVSSIGAVSTVYSLATGFCAAYARVVSTPLGARNRQRKPDVRGTRTSSPVRKRRADVHG